MSTVNFKLEFTQEDLNILASCLSSLPFGQVAPLINKIQMQVQSQMKPPTAPKSKSKKE